MSKFFFFFLYVLIIQLSLSLSLPSSSLICEISSLFLSHKHSLTNHSFKTYNNNSHISSEHFFPFEDVLASVMLAFSRDDTVRANALVAIHAPVLPPLQTYLFTTTGTTSSSSSSSTSSSSINSSTTSSMRMAASTGAARGLVSDAKEFMKLNGMPLNSTLPLSGVLPFKGLAAYAAPLNYVYEVYGFYFLSFSTFFFFSLPFFFFLHFPLIIAKL
jgi:hypothetical protein